MTKDTPKTQTDTTAKAEHFIEPLAMDIDQYTGRIPDGSDGVNAIVKLANTASRIEEMYIYPEGLGDGLPPEIPLLIDRRPGGGILDVKAQIEKFRLFPARRTGTAKVTTLLSFIDLVNRHKDQHSVIFANTAWPTPQLTGLVDYHEKENGKPRHLQHRITYDFPVTEELKLWIKNNGEPMKQAEFALFLEEHAAELSSPFDGEKVIYESLFKERLANPMELVSLSRNLEVFVGAKVKQGVRLQTGERTVEFTEEHTNGKGERVDIPGAFMLQVPAFVDGEPVRIAARLRYRIAQGEIHWFYNLYRWDVELRNRVKNDLVEAAKATELPAFEGSPEV